MLSVVLTAYNRPEGLAATLASLAEQTRAPDEILICDDASPADLKSVADCFSPRLRGLTYIRRDQNLGMPGNLNAGLAAASGDLVANLHDGDRFHPRMLECWEALLLRHPSAGFVFCGTDPATPSYRRKLRRLPELTMGKNFYQRVFRNSWRGSSLVWGTAMVRRALLGSPALDPQFGAVADVDLWMRLCQLADVAVLRENWIQLDTNSHFTGRVRWENVEALRSLHALNLDRTRALGWSSRWHRLLHHWIFQAFYLINWQADIRRGGGRSRRVAAAKSFGPPASLLHF